MANVTLDYLNLAVLDNTLVSCLFSAGKYNLSASGDMLGLATVLKNVNMTLPTGSNLINSLRDK